MSRASPNEVDVQSSNRFATWKRSKQDNGKMRHAQSNIFAWGTRLGEECDDGAVFFVALRLMSCVGYLRDNRNGQCT